MADDLRTGLKVLIYEQARFLNGLDWTEPEEVTLAEKRGRIIQVHRGNVEKTLGMDDTTTEPDQNRGPFGGDTEALKRELERRLLRHIDALGPEGLARRLRQRGVDPASLGLEISGEAGPETTRG